jgi:hypothetical protein
MRLSIFGEGFFFASDNELQTWATKVLNKAQRLSEMKQETLLRKIQQELRYDAWTEETYGDKKKESTPAVKFVKLARVLKKDANQRYLVWLTDYTIDGCSKIGWKGVQLNDTWLEEFDA